MVESIEDVSRTYKAKHLSVLFYANCSKGKKLRLQDVINMIPYSRLRCLFDIHLLWIDAILRTNRFKIKARHPFVLFSLNGQYQCSDME